MTIRPASEWASGETGLFADVPEAAYHAFDACSNSQLSKLAVSPAHLRASIETGWKETPALAFGRAAHCAILQPMEFMARYDTARQCAAVMKTGERCNATGRTRHAGHWFCGRSGHAPEITPDDIEVVSPDDFEAITGIQARMRSMPEVRVLIEQPGGFELSARWIHEPTGLLCKMRMDFLSLHSGILVDLKTARDASPEGFARKMLDYGYHRQAAFYVDGMAALGAPLRHFVLVPFEKEPPYAGCAVRIVDAAVQVGRDELAGLMATYAACKSENAWPGYDTGKIIDIDLPSWVYRKHFEDAEAL